MMKTYYWINNLSLWLLALSILPIFISCYHQNDDENLSSGRSWNSFHHVIGLESERKISGKWKILKKTKATIGVEARMSTVIVQF